MNFQKNKPYNDLPLLPPDKRIFESIAVYKKLSQARAALAELKGRLPVIPNPYMLVNTLVLQEAKDSSEIENIFTTSDKLYRAFASGRSEEDPAVKEVLRYREALWDAYQNCRQLSDWNVDWIVNIFRKITGKDESLRSKQAYIVKGETVIYTPPEPGKILAEKINNWIKYVNIPNNIDPVLNMIILHYQFEAIHPFSDGNGRSGRILNVLYLTSQSLLELPVLYISKYILENKSEYYRLLSAVTEEGDWEGWILFMLEAVYQTSVFTLKKVNAILDLFNQVKNTIQKEAGDIYSRELIETIFSQPYCKIKMLVDSNIAARNTASKYLGRLTELGIMESVKAGKETLYLNRGLFEILSSG